jgi:hypothetical protein
MLGNRVNRLISQRLCRKSLRAAVSSIWLKLGFRTFAETTMMSIVQIELRTSLMAIREEILQSLGRRVVSVLGPHAAKALELSAETVGVISIGHGASWQERHELYGFALP